MPREAVGNRCDTGPISWICLCKRSVHPSTDFEVLSGWYTPRTSDSASNTPDGAAVTPQVEDPSSPVPSPASGQRCNSAKIQFPWNALCQCRLALSDVATTRMEPGTNILKSEDITPSFPRNLHAL